ncbi:MAG: outer membrane beta-barrel protein [Deltaproteobacteria bacterium]
MKLRRLNVMVVVGVVGAALAGARTAAAREAASDCLPEDWFCDDDDAGDLRAPEPESSPDAPEEAPSAPGAARPPPGMLPGKMDLTTSSPDAGLDDQEEAGEALSPWSVNLRLAGVALGSGRRHRDTGLGGVGVSLRYALRPNVDLDLGLDAFGGIDYNGYDRSETSLSVSALWYLNPDRAIRTYLLGGLHASAAQVDVAGDDQDWTYVGAHAGLGLDFAVSERVSLNVDMLGFIRGRTDSRAERQPEFTDGFGNLTNTSGGGVFRGGVSLYW